MQIVSAKQFQRNRSFETMKQTIDEAVFEIIQAVRQHKDEALKTYTKKFDQVNLTDFRVTEKELEAAKQQVDPSFLEAIQRAIDNITMFHQEQKEKSWFMSKAGGIMLGQQIQPIEKVGVYIPGGKAAIDDQAYTEKIVRQIIDTRTWATERLTKLGFCVLPSQTNFLFAEHYSVSGLTIHDRLEENDILIHHFNVPPIENYIRITIGTDEQMEHFFDHLEKVQEQT